MSDPTAAESHADDPSITILRSLRRIIRSIEIASIENASRRGVTSPQLLCLHVLAVAGSITQVELSRKTQLSPPTLVGVIDRLEGKGLVMRQRDPLDRRRIHLVLTGAGRTIAARVPDPLRLHLEHELDAMSGTERAAITSTLLQLAGLLESEPTGRAKVSASDPLPQPAGAEATSSPRR